MANRGGRSRARLPHPRSRWRCRAPLASPAAGSTRLCLMRSCRPTRKRFRTHLKTRDEFLFIILRLFGFPNCGVSQRPSLPFGRALPSASCRKEKNSFCSLTLCELRHQPACFGEQVPGGFGVQVDLSVCPRCSFPFPAAGRRQRKIQPFFNLIEPWHIFHIEKKSHDFPK